MKQGLLLIVVIINMLTINAQENKVEYGGNVGLGLSYFSLDDNSFSTFPDLNVNVNTFLNYYLTPRWGAGLGLGFNNYKSTLEVLDYGSIISEGNDPTSTYQVLLYSDGWQQKVSLSTLSIPIGAVYRNTLSQTLSLRTFAGLNLELPLTSSYARSGGSLSTRLIILNLCWMKVKLLWGFQSLRLTNSAQIGRANRGVLFL